MMTQSSYEKAESRWAALDGERQALARTVTGAKLALSMARSRNADRVPQHLREATAEFAEEAETAPHRLEAKINKDHARLRKLEQEKVPIEYERLAAARRARTNELAASMQPEHRAIIQRMTDAVQALSDAILAERELHARLKREAPLDTSAKLPNVSQILGTGALSDRDSQLWAYRAFINRLGILK